MSLYYSLLYVSHLAKKNRAGKGQWYLNNYYLSLMVIKVIKV